MKWKCNSCKQIQEGMRRTRQGFKWCRYCGSHDIEKIYRDDFNKLVLRRNRTKSIKPHKPKEL